ncbi:BrnT family toxin [Parahaliea maris]|uniref:BrnT family toxin n=1 Tax=Parahaliea maris TaxID=2716870 RepID=A0A5C9A853_9GAMM|nr:BrnT family toxin [Parahaliea maris]
MKYEWDRKKAERNLEVHGVSFEYVEKFEWDSVLEWEDRRENYQETRMISFAPIEDRLYCLVYTMRGEVCRVISLRKANSREVDHYEQKG